MKTIWLVMGTPGEYHDRAVWAVRAFEVQSEAESFAQRCTAEAERLYAAYEEQKSQALLDGRDDWKMLDDYGDDHTLDPHCAIQYTGTSYTVQAIPFGSPITPPR